MLTTCLLFRKPDVVTFFYYVALDEGAKGSLEPVFGSENDPRMMTGIKGRTGYLSNFEVNFVVDEKYHANSKPQFFFTALHR